MKFLKTREEIFAKNKLFKKLLVTYRKHVMLVKE